MINAQKLNEIAKEIAKMAPGIGFGLVMFELDTQMPEFRWISNANRNDMIAAFEQLLIKWKNDNVQNN